MKLFLALAVAAAPLFAQCTYTISGGTPSDPAVFNLPAAPVDDANGPNTAVATVTSPDACPWQATVNPAAASWLTVYPVQPGPGNGRVGFSVARNPTNVARKGFITVVSATITVNQAAAVCAYSLNPSTMTFQVGGGSGNVQIGANCVWSTGVTDPSWITIQPPASGTFEGKFSYTVAPNACLASRTGGIVVGYPGTQAVPQLLITEDGSPNNLSISPTTATIGPNPTDGKIDVTIGSGCPWNAFSDVSWLQITSAPAGSGVGAVTYHAAANPSSTRTGHITVGPQIFTITQQAIAAPPITLTAITNAASYVQDGVSPGEIVSLFGTNMGPTVGVPLQITPDGKSITTSLGGVQALFDGIPAPLTYVSATQINAVVPYALSGKFNTQVQVQYQNASSNVVSLGVQNAGPGIFTQDASSTGPGAILNQDLTTNTASNRVARGSVVAIYLTGGGATNPVSVDAAITTSTPPFPVLTQPVSIIIGGVVAPEISYSGAAPGLIGGLTQINVKVPDGVIPGPSVPIVIGIGAWVSKSGVTLAVK